MSAESGRRPSPSELFGRLGSALSAEQRSQLHTALRSLGHQLNNSLGATRLAAWSLREELGTLEAEPSEILEDLEEGLRLLSTQVGALSDAAS